MVDGDRRFQRPLAKPEHAGKDYGRIGERRQRNLPDRANEEDGGLTSVVILVVFVVLAFVWALSKWRL